ncbi:hypothetical protein EVAR_75762_1 [Eumeta japonica]|uniref:Uncharacterized protein n=1 Tax=Eumeta variegata TaxID=151549 RepID=A0A4C1TCX8_EUMVA|nr:hypothetical protein EVAR_75762_1 [Eumeta japonica]
MPSSDLAARTHTRRNSFVPESSRVDVSAERGYFQLQAATGGSLFFLLALLPNTVIIQLWVEQVPTAVTLILTEKECYCLPPTGKRKWRPTGYSA